MQGAEGSAYLVSDVGGTNTRIGLTGPEGLPRQIVRYRNDLFASFYEVLEHYRQATALPPLQGCCVAVAGPVTSARAQLTNRDWSFEAARIAALLPGPPSRPVRLVNDLAALGHALAALNRDQLQQITPAAPGAPLNDQALVAGLGTGFNVCLVKGSARNPVVIEAELGHASLPCSVTAVLQAEIGDAARGFDTVETLFSGCGLARLYRILSGGDQRSGAEILAAYGDREGAGDTRAVDLLARLLGYYTRELVLQYLPFGGVHFAGGAARGILGSAARALFLQSFDAPGRFADHLRRVPLRLVTDDAAALTGAARVLTRTGPA